MKDENKNIDAFFSSRLQNDKIEDDGWNMPSDDIWNAAKPKFIDRKKTKRRFAFWWLFPLLVLGFSVGFLLLEGKEVNTTELDYLTIQEDEEVAVSNSKNEKKEITSGHEATYKNQNELTENLASPTKIGKEQSAIEGPSNLINKKSILKETQTNESKNHIPLRNNQEQIIPNGINDNETYNIDKEPAILNQNKLDRQVIQLVNIASAYNHRIKIESVNDEKLTFEAPEILPYLTELIIPIESPVFTHEVGASHSALLLNLLISFGIDSDNGVDEYDLSCTYYNANVTGRKWINKSFSLTSGLQYSYLGLDIDFSVYDTLDKDLFQFINEEFNDAKSRSSINDSDTDFMIDLKDGVNVDLGDELNIKGNVKQHIKAIQIPLFLDYHIYKKRLEYIVGVGVTLEYLSLTETPEEFAIFMDDERISKPLTIPAFRENYIDGSIYLKSGIRYSILEQFSLGLDAKINLLGLPFSGLDVGLYYRW